MKNEDVNRIAVVGAGLMGHGIALEFALAGYEVHLNSRNETSLRKGTQSIRDSLDRLVSLKKISRRQSDAAVKCIVTTASLERAVNDVEVVIESVYEDLALKQQIFKDLEGLCSPQVVLASNTSSFMLRELAASSRLKDRIIVAHFINPPFLVPLVEIVRSTETSDKTVEVMYDLLRKIGKCPILLKQEAPGFVTGRLQAALLREALWLVENGVASPQDVDLAIKTSIGQRWAVAGVFEVLELAGWDLMLAITSALFPHLSSSKSAPLLQRLVDQGDLGVKSGKGMYEWNAESAESLRLRIAEALARI